MTEVERKTGMTDTEADYWDEYFTRNPPTVDLSRNRIKAPRVGHLTITLTLDEGLIERLTSMAQHTHHTPSELVTTMVRREMAYA
ncbi:MAG: hypothetical protein LBM77_07515 [Spirochaetaceae bacterium]|jgi:hypothetical protein|nr:hypothetical protein [Spirochaetaceae bacterium]